jgi:hypothetical protein
LAYGLFQATLGVGEIGAVDVKNIHAGLDGQLSRGCGGCFFLVHHEATTGRTGGQKKTCPPL